jgi:hypothetical protein
MDNIRMDKMDFRKAFLSVAAGLPLFAWVASEAAEIQESGGAIVIRNSCASLELSRGDFSLRQIRDLIRKEDYVKEPGGSLFRIALWDPKHAGKKLDIPNWSTPVDAILDARKATSFEYSNEVKDGKAILSLKYRGIPAGMEMGLVDVTVTVSLADGSGLFEWGISMLNATRLQLYEAHFPLLQGLASGIPGSEKSDYLVKPRQSGIKMESPRSEAVTEGVDANCYPPGGGVGMSVQLLCYSDGQGGSLYLASHDPAAYSKALIHGPCASKKAFQWYVIHYADQPGIGEWKLPYPIFCGPIQGDWYDAAKIYKRMFADKTWKPLSERKDIAPWFRDLSVWFQGQDWDPKSRLDGFGDRLVKIREMLGEDYGFHWYIWQKYPRHDYRNPDYLPARPGFKEAVEKVERAGVHAMPYINICQFETTMPMWWDEHAEDFAIRNIEGEVDTNYAIQGIEHFDDRDEKKQMAWMCFGTSYWRYKLEDIERRIIGDYNVDAVYLDQLYTSTILCYSSTHEHRTHGGAYMTGWSESCSNASGT